MAKANRLIWPLLLLFLPLPIFAQSVALDEDENLYEKRTGWLPYFFATDSLGTAIGVAGFTAGVTQPQTSMFGTLFVTSNNSILASGALNNYRLSEKSRVLVDTFVLLDRFTDQRFYGGDTLAGDTFAGSNDSNPDSYATGSSDEITFSVNFKYRFPWGSLRDDPIAVYRLKNGLLKEGPPGGGTWNPLTHGQTTAGAKFFYTNRDLSNYVLNQFPDTSFDEKIEARTNGVKLWLEHNNTDFTRNPSRGSRQVLSLHQDFGWFDSSDSWTNIQIDLSKYFDLGASDWFRQKVIALNFWTADTLDWERKPDGNVNHRPPPGYGSELGDYDRLRSYSRSRFRDKSAVYYTAELRLIPGTQPLRDLPLINYFEIDWWQIVPFIEAGRVGPQYNTDLYYKDLKWDAGVGIRLMAFRTVVRLDIAVGDEGASAWAMISQPFAR
jgi:hypothetical protein